MMTASYDYPLAGALWTMIVFFGWVIWIWLLFMIFGDLFRRRDIGGWAKAGWTIFVLVVPLLGALVYLIAQGHHMAERRVVEAEAAQENFESYVRSVSHNGGNPAKDISDAKQLLDSGVISPEEFESLKRKALAG